ncbi:MAG: tetratricopeptide repeat-containing sulfotransferase family protein [Pseudooceanicola atlanticus]
MTPSDDTSGSARFPDGDRADALSRARALFDTADYRGAEAIYTGLLVRDPDHVTALIGAAVCASRARRDVTGAMALLDRAEALAPRNPHLHQTRAALLNAAGDFDGAVAAARHTLDLDPHWALAYVNLTDSTRIAPGDPVFDQAETALNADLPVTDRVLIHFALGKAHQDCGDWDAAFAHYKAGNDGKPDRADMAGFATAADRQKGLFDQGIATTLTGATRTTPRPAFILGMPRSGTTLLERMLAAHPEVSTTGERPEFGRLTDDLIRQAQLARRDLPPDQAIRAALTQDNCATIARTYLQAILPHADRAAPVLIDKLPLNFWNIGMIAAVFETAPILHIRRHPLDTCLSNYMANFETGLSYSTRLDTLGQYFRIYDDLMQHWDRVFPGRIIAVNYEDLVTDPEPQLRRILAACDLHWSDACLRPEETGGVIATASRWQARQKVYQSSVQKWRRYERHLDPLIAALGGMSWIEGHEARRFT